MTAVEERTLPHNLEAERAVLGAVLVHNSAMDVVADTLPARDFYRDGHRRIFERMLALHVRGEAIDFVTLREELGRKGELDEVGGPAYVASLADGVPRATNIEYYARIIREKAGQREIIYAANKLLSAAYNQDDDPAALLDFAERTLLDVSLKAVPGDLVSAPEMVQRIYPVIEALQEAGKPITGLPTGLPSLDRFTRGLQRGSLVILAGRTSTGKSSLALQIALHVAKAAPVAFFSVEMSQQEQVFRVLTTLARVDGHHLQCGRLSMIDAQQVGVAMTEFAQRHFWLDDTGSLSPLQIRSRARRLKARHGLGLIIVDYLQLLSHARADSREQAVAATSRTLKHIARELDVPMLALGQLSRAPEQRQEKRPQLSDLRESGAIEQDADVVLLIHRSPSKSDGIVTETPPAELIIAKQRNGPTASIDLAWIGEQYRFGELEARV